MNEVSPNVENMHNMIWLIFHNYSKVSSYLKKKKKLYIYIYIFFLFVFSMCVESKGVRECLDTRERGQGD